jgi:hypothetical protein
VTRNERPVLRLWISDALLADSIRASRLRSLLLEAAMYALNRNQYKDRGKLTKSLLTVLGSPRVYVPS